MTNTKIQTLLDCPFCGIDYPEWCDEYDTHGRLSYFIECRGCDSTTGRHHKTKDEAVAAWNRRDERIADALEGKR